MHRYTAIRRSCSTLSSSTAPSPFRSSAAHPLRPDKFRDPFVTADGSARASVQLTDLTTLWFNTGTLCNASSSSTTNMARSLLSKKVACAICYIESSPRNDALVYLSAAEVRGYLGEIAEFATLETESGGANGLTGSTTAACSNPSATSRPPRPRRSTMPRSPHRLWRRDSNSLRQTRSGSN